MLFGGGGESQREIGNFDACDHHMGGWCANQLDSSRAYTHSNQLLLLDLVANKCTCLLGFFLTSLSEKGYYKC